MTRLRVVLTALALGVLLAGASLPHAHAQKSSSLQDQILKAQEMVLPALVHVQPISEVFSAGKKRKETGVGSGVIIRPDGTIITNYHVVGKEATRIFVTLANKERVSAELIGGDPYTDVAVIRLTADAVKEPVAYARLGDSDQLQAGEFVIALGSPLSLSRSISHGIISCLDRYLGEDDRLPTGERTGNFNTWIQTDAAINFGNSGGPLVSLKGEVIGINSRRGGILSDNLGFAIPINVVKEVMEKILQDKEVIRSTVGITIQPLQELEDFFGVTASQGALIAGVAPASPAADAGIQLGDIMLSFNGTETSARFAEQIPAIYKLIADTPVDKTIPVIVVRQGESQPLTLRVKTQKLGASVGEDFECSAWGFAVRGLTDQDARERRLPDTAGVLVSSKALEGENVLRSLDVGDVIRAVNGTEIPDLDRFREVYEETTGAGRPVVLKVQRAAMTRFVALEPMTIGVPVNEE